MKEKIKKLVQQYDKGGFTYSELEWELLNLYAVMQRSEQLPCERCKKLEFMIENGLGWKDIENDCT